MILIQTAYQAGQPKIALPVITVVDPLVSCLIGVTLFGEDVLLGGARAPLIGIAAGFMFFGLVSLARTSPVPEAVGPGDEAADVTDRHRSGGDGGQGGGDLGGPRVNAATG